ncbi:MAG: type II toxin-antitoxin system Phd/YefM family antitoxin [Chloroflexi bacterium]|nr:type II toxin-antitoxin system Phd/YefM family antitoxin [Chloroflexota bacterium]
MTVAVNAAEARTLFGELMARVSYGGERIIVKRRGKPSVALISVEDLRRLEAMEDERDAELLRLAKETNEGYVGVDELIAAYEERAGKPWTEGEASA